MANAGAMKIPGLHHAETWLRRWRDRWIEQRHVPRYLSIDMLWSKLAVEGYVLVRKCGDHRIAFDPSDQVIGRALILNGDWQRGDSERAIGFLSANGMLAPDGVFVDVGANICTQSVYASLSGRFARVLALEPSPAEFELLGINVRLNGLTGTVDCRQVAVGAKASSMALALNAVNRGDHRLVEEPGANCVAVNVLPLDAILEGEGIDAAEVGLVWIDVQGHEPQVCEGMPRVLAAGVPLVIEFNVEDYGEAGTRAFAGHLAQHYDSFVDIADESLVVRRVPDLAMLPRVADVLVFRSAARCS